MNTKLTVFRAISFFVMKRVLLITTIIGSIFFGLILIIIWLLAYLFSPWWWLLLVVFAPLFVISLLVRLLVSFLTNKLFYKEPFTTDQSVKLKAFVTKLQNLAEARGMSLPVFAFINAKDILFYRDLRTARSAIDDASGLQGDFVELERLFRKS